MSKPKPLAGPSAPAPEQPIERPEFRRLDTLRLAMVCALLIRPEDYKTAMHEIGIPEHCWHEWPDPGCAWVATYRNGTRCPGKHVVVCLGDTAGSDGIDIATILVHEAVHVWQSITNHISERNPADEQSAYAIQAISEDLMRDYARQTGLTP